MILKQGTQVEVANNNGRFYFQSFTTGYMDLNFDAKCQLEAILLSEEGDLMVVGFRDIRVAVNDRDNIIREFIEHAMENSVAPTDLVNLALRSIE